MFFTAVTGFTALHRAAQRGDDAEVASLIEKGADVTARDSEGRTPLHHAVMRGHLGIVDQLLSSGGPSLLLSKDILNCTPVHLAAVQNQVTLIIRLVESLLDDEDGRTPLHEVARRRCMQDFMGFLHLGWESATVEDDGTAKPLPDLSPLWSIVGSVIDLKRPGLPTVQRVLGWHPLHVAAMSGNIELIKRLVQQFDCDLRVKSMNSWTPLHYAAAYNQVAAIEALCALGCEVAVQDAVGSTPMHVAAGEGHLEAVKALIELGCSPQVVDRDGCTPLYCAAAWNRIEAVRLLEAMHCPSSLRSLEGRTPIHVAAEQGWVDLIDVLVQEFGNAVDARDNYQFTPLHSAANGGHVAAIRRLAALGHDLNAKDYLGRTPLHYAGMHGRTGAVEALVELGAGLEEKDSRGGGYTPLHLAADAGQCDAIARLIALGAEVDAPSSKALPPLALALMKGPANVDAVALLVELGANVAATLEQRTLETPLHVAARSGRADIIERLIKCPCISVSAQTKDGSTPLHYAAAFGQTHVLELFVNAGCPVDARDNALNTPMHLAAGCGFLETVAKLVELGADINARDCTDCTPLQNAAHGTYSALAAMPSNGSSLANGSASGYARFNPPHQPQLTRAQQKAQAALTSGSSVKKDGLVPVRTGLAWSHQYSGLDLPPPGPGAASLTFSGPGVMASSTALTPGGVTAAGSYNATLDVVLPASSSNGAGALTSSSSGSSGSGSNPTQDLWATWKSLGLTQLLKKAYRQQQKRQDRGSTSASSGTGSQAAAQLQQTQQTVQAALQQMQAALQQSQAALQQQLLAQLQQGQGSVPSAAQTTASSALTFDAKSSALGPSAAAGTAMGGSDSLDALLRRSEQLQLSSGEQDRARLIKVVEKLVELGADLHAVDNEGRTALHLAAGCGDRSMALRLVELGTDVNCRDSVGGTAMHHAAMANKKDMMFSLARLGCDWRARADGIDGATASFVLCGQHGKTTRQQRLLDAKLKRVFQEGAAAKAAGRNPLADAKDDGEDDEAADLEAEQALADAAMAALLEEVEAEAEESAKKAKKKKKKAKGKAGSDGQQHDTTEEATSKESGAAKDAGASEPLPASATSQGNCGDSAPAEPPASPEQYAGHAAPAAETSTDAMSEMSEHDPIRVALDAAADAASRLLCEHGEEVTEQALEEAIEDLDAAVERATAAGVSAKYGKKVRKKLQVSLDRMRGIYVEPAHEATPPAVEKTPEPQATAKQHRKLPNSSGGVHQPPLPPPRLPPGSAPAMPKPEPPRPVAPAAAAGMQPAMPPAQGASRHQQQQGGAPWGKPPPPPPTQPKPAGIPPPPPGLPPYGSAMQPHAPANYAAAAAGPNAAPAPASPLFTQPQPASMGLLFGDTPAPGPPAPPSPFGLFGEHQPLGYEAVSPRNGGPSPHDGLFAGGAFFSANVHQEAAQSLGSGGFPGLDAYGSDGASLPVQFAGMDLGGQGPVPSPFPPGFGSQAQGHGAPLDTFIGQDLAAHVFGHDDGMPGAGHVEDPLQAVDAGGPLLSFDLMDELDGTPHSAQAAAARLPDDPGSLFRGTPGPPSMVTMPGGGQGAFRPLW